MMDGFGKNAMVYADMWYWYRNVILDTSIWDYDDCFWIQKRVFEYFVKITNVCILDFLIFAIYYMKRKTIRKIVY